MTVTEELRRMVALNLIKDLGPVTFKKLTAHFGGLEGIFRASPGEFRMVEGVRKNVAEAFAKRELLKEADAEIRKAQKAKVGIITLFDPRYPEALKNIFDAPNLLYVKGRLPETNTPHVAVVGSRAASFYGLKMAKQIAEDLAAAGVVVVSGLALGIDSASHEGALAANGVTLAVLGGGLNHVHRTSNKKMAEAVCEKGALISEYPMDMSPEPGFFPVRNRIISGLSQAVLVVEAREKSGALIMVSQALEQGRDVFAVPGNADSPRSMGTNRLIKDGAKIVVSAADILEELKINAPKKSASNARHAELNEIENRLLSLLSEETLPMDELIDRSQMPPSQAASTLSMLEIKGCVKQLPGKNYTKI